MKGNKGKAGEIHSERGERFLNRGINALLFFINFLFLYFIWVILIPGVTGFSRLIPCWLLAFVITWGIARFTKTATRLYLTLGFLGLLVFVLLSNR